MTSTEVDTMDAGSLRAAYRMLMNDYQHLAASYESLVRQQAPAEQEPVAYNWEVFAGYLLDKCEGQAIYEESLQGWLSDMITDPDYAHLFCPKQQAAPAQPVNDTAAIERVAELEKRPTVEACDATCAAMWKHCELVSELEQALQRAATAMWNSEANMDNDAADIEEALADYHEALSKHGEKAND